MATAPTPSQTYEKLGVFYLGKVYDPAQRRRTDDLVLYDSRDLLTHCVCVGMTGSGKTGLCIGLLEEAAIDGVPSIIIDPKGDLTNLLLTFPDLSPADFRPWINTDDAQRKQMSPEEYAARQAETWKAGLESWQQGGERIRRLKDAADFVIFTPGSNSGLPLSIMKSFDPPPPEVLDDSELLHERIESTVQGLISMLELPVTAMQATAYLGALIEHWWGTGAKLDLPTLVRLIAEPPITRVGALELNEFLPPRKRADLAVALNALIASPSFRRLGEGAPVDIQSLLYAKDGKPRCAIVSIAHLGDNERQFVVSVLLNEMLAWTRRQSGTTSLRAILYMDEIAGYCPPSNQKAPPTKAPLLTLLKQARAFGVGVVLVTQNPVDLDYKGLANTGTWLLGRLQTDRDKQRILDGLEGAASATGSAFDRAAMDSLLSGLGARVFLMQNVHAGGPLLLESRWCMSYLRGPLTRDQIKVLMDPKKPGQSSSVSGPGAAAAPSGSAISQRPIVGSEIPEFFIPARTSEPVHYLPGLFAMARVAYGGTRAGVESEVYPAVLMPFENGAVVVNWDELKTTDLTDKDLDREPASNASFGQLPPDALKPKSYDRWKKEFADSLYRNQLLTVYRCNSYKLASTPGETEVAFRARVAHAAREERDQELDALRSKYAPKLQTLQDRLRRAEQAVEVQKEQASSAKMSTAFSVGAALLSAFLGKKVISAGSVGKATTAARGASRSMKESSDVGRAEENCEAIRAQMQALQTEFETAAAELAASDTLAPDLIETLQVKPKKTDIAVRTVVLTWMPHTKTGDTLTPAW